MRGCRRQRSEDRRRVTAIPICQRRRQHYQAYLPIKLPQVCASCGQLPFARANGIGRAHSHAMFVPGNGHGDIVTVAGCCAIIDGARDGRTPAYWLVWPAPPCTKTLRFVTASGPLLVSTKRVVLAEAR